MSVENILKQNNLNLYAASLTTDNLVTESITVENINVLDTAQIFTLDVTDDMNGQVVKASNIDSETSIAGALLVSDGAGNAAWEDYPGPNVSIYEANISQLFTAGAPRTTFNTPVSTLNTQPADAFVAWDGGLSRFNFLKDGIYQVNFNISMNAPNNPGNAYITFDFINSTIGSITGKSFSKLFYGNALGPKTVIESYSLTFSALAGQTLTTSASVSADSVYNIDTSLLPVSNIEIIKLRNN